MKLTLFLTLISEYLVGFAYFPTHFIDKSTRLTQLYLLSNFIKSATSAGHSGTETPRCLVGCEQHSLNLNWFTRRHLVRVQVLVLFMC